MSSAYSALEVVRAELDETSFCARFRSLGLWLMVLRILLLAASVALFGAELRALLLRPLYYLTCFAFKIQALHEEIHETGMQQRIQAVIKASRREGQAMSVLSCVVFVPLFPSIGYAYCERATSRVMCRCSRCSG